MIGQPFLLHYEITCLWQIRGMRSFTDHNECLLCCVHFLFNLIETLVRFFNKYAYVQVLCIMLCLCLILWGFECNSLLLFLGCNYWKEFQPLCMWCMGALSIYRDWSTYFLWLLRCYLVDDNHLGRPFDWNLCWYMGMVEIKGSGCDDRIYCYANGNDFGKYIFRQ
jgi:hypothetical protein